MPKRGRPAIPIERDPQRFELACWWAFHEMGCGPFDAARRSLMVVKGGPITLEDIEGVLRLSSVQLSLPEVDDEPNAIERRLSAKAKGQPPWPWLVESSALIQGLIVFIGTRNLYGACLCLDNLVLRGWRPVLTGLTERVETALKSNVPPADLATLGPDARALVERLTGVPLPRRPHRKKK
jgi:hypothetical protein